MKRLIVALSLVAVCVVAVSAVTFGQPDGNRHPYVGTILFKTATGYYSCSATLMSPTVMLTAGHCTEEEGALNLQTWANFSPVISFAGIDNYASVDDYLNDPANGWITGTAVPHPQYDDFSQFPATYDVGVVVLDEAVNRSTYGVLAPLGFLETIRSTRNNSFTVVGYGMQGLIKPFREDIYARYFGQVRLVELKSHRNFGHSAKFTNNPGRGGGTCFGDSGGPVLYGNTNMVVAVVS